MSFEQVYHAPVHADVFELRPPKCRGQSELPHIATFLRWQARTTDACTAQQARKAQALFGAGAGPGLAGGVADLSCTPFIRRGELSIERVKNGASNASVVQLSVIGASETQPPFVVLRPRLPTDVEAQDADMRGKQPRCPQDAFVEVSQKILLVSSTAVLARSNRTASQCSSSPSQSLFALCFPRFSVCDMDELINALRQHTRQRIWHWSRLYATTVCTLVLRPRYHGDKAELAAWGARIAGRGVGTGIKLGAQALGSAVVGVAKLATHSKLSSSSAEAMGGQHRTSASTIGAVQQVPSRFDGPMTSATGALAEASGTAVGHACAVVGQHATCLWTEHSAGVTMKLARGIGKVRRKFSDSQKRAAADSYRLSGGFGNPPNLTEDKADGAEDWLLVHEGKHMLLEATTNDRDESFGLSELFVADDTAASDEDKKTDCGKSSMSACNLTSGFICPSCHIAYSSAEALLAHDAREHNDTESSNHVVENVCNAVSANKVATNNAQSVQLYQPTEDDFEVAQGALTKASTIGKSVVVGLAHVTGGMFVGTQTMVRSAGTAVAEVGGVVGGGVVKDVLLDATGAAANTMSVKANLGFRSVGKRFIRSSMDKSLNK